MNPLVFIVAGELSGDNHGARLVRAVKKMMPGAEFIGIGGDGMAAEGVNLLYHIRDMSFMGFWEVLRHLPFIHSVLRQVRSQIYKRKPELFILIDYPGFNLHLAARVKKLGIPVVYYIAPQVWAWGRNRVKKMAKRIDKLLVIFPFEEQFFSEHNISAQFVGHPLIEELEVNVEKESFFCSHRLDPSRPVMALLPGSREQEVERLLPEMVDAFTILQDIIPGLQGVIGLSSTLADSVYAPFLTSSPGILALRHCTHEIMAHSDFVIVASGTAALETAIFNTPMIIVYKVSDLSYRIAKKLIRVPFIGIVNIIANKRIVPEILQKEATGKNIAETVWSIYSDPARIRKMKNALTDIVGQLGKKRASEEAAREIVAILDSMDHQSH